MSTTDAKLTALHCAAILFALPTNASLWHVSLDRRPPNSMRIWMKQVPGSLVCRGLSVSSYRLMQAVTDSGIVFCTEIFPHAGTSFKDLIGATAFREVIRKVKQSGLDPSDPSHRGFFMRPFQVLDPLLAAPCPSRSSPPQPAPGTSGTLDRIFQCPPCACLPCVSTPAASLHPAPPHPHSCAHASPSLSKWSSHAPLPTPACHGAACWPSVPPMLWTRPSHLHLTKCASAGSPHLRAHGEPGHRPLRQVHRPAVGLQALQCCPLQPLHPTPRLCRCPHEDPQSARGCRPCCH